MNEFGNEHVLRSLDVRRNKNGVHVEFVAVCEFVAVLITKLYKKKQQYLYYQRSHPIFKLIVFFYNHHKNVIN